MEMFGRVGLVEIPILIAPDQKVWMEQMIKEGKIAIPPGGTLEKGSLYSMFIRMLLHNAMEEQKRQEALEADDEDDVTGVASRGGAAMTDAAGAAACVGSGIAKTDVRLRCASAPPLLAPACFSRSMKARTRSTVLSRTRPPKRSRLTSLPSFTASRPKVDSAMPTRRQ